MEAPCTLLVQVWALEFHAPIRTSNFFFFIPTAFPNHPRSLWKTGPSNLYLQHADGTPFFWLGDTHWSGFSSAEHFFDSNDPRFKTMFEGMLQMRAKQGGSLNSASRGG